MKTLLLLEHRSYLKAAPRSVKYHRLVVLDGELGAPDLPKELSYRKLFPKKFQQDLWTEAAETTEALALGQAGLRPLSWPLLEDSVPGWWLIDKLVFDAVHQAKTAMAKAARIRERVKPDQVVLIVGDPLLGSLIEQVLVAGGCKVTRITPARSLVGSDRQSLFSRLLPKPAQTEELLLRLASWVRGLPAPSKNKPPLLFVARSGFWRPRDEIEPDIGSYTDAYIGELIDEAAGRDNFWPVTVAARLSRGPMTVSGGFSHFKRMLSGTLPYIPLEIFASAQVSAAETRALDWVRQRRRELHSFTPKTGRLLSVNKIDLWPYLGPKIQDSLTGIPRLMQRYILFRNMVRTMSPKAVVQYGEATPIGRILTLTCQAEKTPVIGIQNQIVLDYEYHHPRTGVCTAGEDSAKGCPVPDLTLALGPLWRDHLVQKCGYPEEAVQAPGFHRLDHHFASRRKPKRSAQSILLITTPNSHRELKKINGCLEQLLTERTDLRLSIKPHPAATGAGLTELGGYNGSISIAAPESPLRPLIQQCDLVIAQQTTAIVEAVAAGKPVVMVDLSGLPEQFPFSKLGLVQRVEKEAELVAVVESMLEDYQLRQDLVAKADAALESILTGLDSQATKRILDLIEDLAAGR